MEELFEASREVDPKTGVHCVHPEHEVDPKTPFHCVHREHVDISPKLNKPSDSPFSLDISLREACRNGYYNYVSELLKNQNAGDLNVPCLGYGNTPLLVALKSGHANIAELLLEHGANVSIRNRAGQTPLYWASYHGYKEMITKYIILGPTYSSDINCRDDKGNTALLAAAASRQSSTALLLLKHGANASAIITNQHGNTALHIACQNCMVDLAKEILIRDLSCLNCQNIHGETPLVCALNQTHPHNRTMLAAVAKLLMENGADTKIYQRGCHPLFLACTHGLESVVRLMLEKGTSLQDPMENTTPLESALVHGHVTTAEVLLEYGAVLNPERFFAFWPFENVNKRAFDGGQNLLHKACDSGSERVVRLLLEQLGANIRRRTRDGRSPLDIARWRRQDAIVKLLQPSWGGLVWQWLRGSSSRLPNNSNR